MLRLKFRPNLVSFLMKGEKPKFGAGDVCTKPTALCLSEFLYKALYYYNIITSVSLRLRTT